MFWLNMKSWIFETKIFRLIYVYGGTVAILIKYKGDCDAALKALEKQSARKKLQIKHLENRLYERRRKI